MSSTSITVLTCDRCAAKVEIRASGDDGGWGKLALRLLPVAGGLPVSIGEGGGGYDICAACGDELLAWCLRRDGLDPETPADDGGAIATLLAAMLRRQTLDALEAARDQPTSLISGDDPEAAFARIDDRARELARETLALFRRGGATRA